MTPHVHQHASEMPTVEPGSILRRTPQPTLEWVEVDGEVVCWHAERDALHLLDPVASLVFQLCDGVAPLDTTIDDLADAFGRDRSTVGPDVLAFAAELQRLALVEHVD